MGLVGDLVKAGSVGFVEDAVEHVGLFFVAKKAASNRLFFETSIWPVAHRRGTLPYRISGNA